MLSFHSQLKVFVATAPCDLRMSFNGLWNAAQQQLGEDPKSGALFVFGNRRRNRIKILCFDGTGLCVLAKRLESGTFAWPHGADEPNAKICRAHKPCSCCSMEWNSRTPDAGRGRSGIGRGKNYFQHSLNARRPLRIRSLKSDGRRRAANSNPTAPTAGGLAARGQHAAASVVESNPPGARTIAH